MTTMLPTAESKTAEPQDAAPVRVPTPSAEESLTVLHSVPNCWLEPTQTWLDQQLRALPATIENHVVTERRANRKQFDRPNVHAFEEQSWWPKTHERILRRLHRGRRRPHLLRVARECGARILHSHFGYEAWRNAPVARHLNLKHVVTFYGVDVNALPQQGWLRRYRSMFLKVDLVLCEGPHMARCIANLGCNPTKIAVHHLGVDCDHIPIAPRQWDGIEPARFLIAASFREKKGIPDAIEALARIRDELLFEVTIIGDAPDTPRGRREKARILKAIQRHGLDLRVRMLGFQPPERLRQEALNHHVFLSTSRTASNGDTEGGAPVCLAEMLATGMPVLATRHCDIPNVVQHGVSGWLAEEGDIDGLEHGLRWLLDAAPNWDDMGHAGHAYIKQNFHAAHQGEALAERYLAMFRSTFR